MTTWPLAGYNSKFFSCYNRKLIRDMMNLFIFFGFLVIWFHLCQPIDVKTIFNDISTGDPAKVLIVIPGLGRSDRLKTVVQNIRILFEDQTDSSRLELNCVIYIYVSRSDSSFWSNKDEIAYLSKYCELIENINKKVTENIYMIQPAYLRKNFHYVFLLLDDCLIKEKKDFQLQGMIDLMRCNKLSVVSPLIIGANKGGGQKFRNIMQIESPSSIAGYVSSFVEIFAWVMTVPAYTVLWNLLCPEINPYAWGYDFWYDHYAKTLLQDRHRMGITSIYRLYHEQDTTSTGLGRTDQTSFNEKWNAVLAQERHYMKHHNIRLAYFRKNLDLSNSSWNGAVKGTLLSCP